MKATKKYNINILNLNNQQYHYQYDINSSFFDSFMQDLLQNGDLTANILLTKTENLTTINFSIKGTVELCCDRSLELFDHPINVNKNLIIKYGLKNEELTDEIISIKRNTTSINIAKYLYDYIMLAIPMKKIHPKFLDQYKDTSNETLLIYSSYNETENEVEIDSRWDALQKLTTDYTDKNATKAPKKQPQRH